MDFATKLVAYFTYLKLRRIFGKEKARKIIRIYMEA